MGKIFLFFAMLFLLVIFSGCLLQSAPLQRAQKTPTQYCIELCQAEKVNGTDFSNGPCIGNPIAQVPDWVCDIAHNPRVGLDDLKENQCLAFLQGRAQHFVELDEQCNLIKKV